MARKRTTADIPTPRRTKRPGASTARPIESAATAFQKVREVGLRLPGVEESSMYGKPALKVRGKMFACVASHRSAEPDSLVVRVDFEQRAELLAADPDVYYITDHYQDYPAVLIRLHRVQPEVLKDLLGMACRLVWGEAASPSQRSHRPE